MLPAMITKNKNKIPQIPEDFFSFLGFKEGAKAGGKDSSGRTTSGSSMGGVTPLGAESLSGFGFISLLVNGFPKFNE